MKKNIFFIIFIHNHLSNIESPCAKAQGHIFHWDFFIKVLPSHLIFGGDFFLERCYPRTLSSLSS